MLRVALALVCLLGADCAVTGSRSTTDNQEIGARAVELEIAYLRQGDTIRAEENMYKALDVGPRLPEAHASLALVFQQEQEWTLAESHFEEEAFEQARVLDVRLDQFGSLSSRRFPLCGLVAHHFSDEARAQDCYAAMKKRYPRTDEAKRLGDLVEERT